MKTFFINRTWIVLLTLVLFAIVRPAVAQPPDPETDPTGLFDPNDVVMCGDIVFMLDISSSMNFFSVNGVTR